MYKPRGGCNNPQFLLASCSWFFWQMIRSLGCHWFMNGWRAAYAAIKVWTKRSTLKFQQPIVWVTRAETNIVQSGLEIWSICGLLDWYSPWRAERYWYLGPIAMKHFDWKPPQLINSWLSKLFVYWMLTSIQRPDGCSGPLSLQPTPLCTPLDTALLIL